MSIRRKPGDWVWVKAGTGFTDESNRLKVEIQDQGCSPCFLCNDPECTEWDTLWTEPDPENSNKRHMLCHVAECEMFDEKQ